MKTFIALLRGINVSGKNKIKMAELKTSLQMLGLENVSTYIQSGNIVFQSATQNSKALQKNISDGILKDFGLTVPTLVLSYDDLKKVLNENPYSKSGTIEQNKLHITFLDGAPDITLVQSLEQNTYLPDEFSFSGKAIYLHCPNGYGKTKLNNSFFEKKLKTPATTRNLKTSNKLLEMAFEIG